MEAVGIRKMYPQIYHAWNGARTRCGCPTNKDYPRYGGRGISFTDRWNDFETFCEWSLLNGWEPGLSLDRIDVNGDYCPENCRWTTYKVQANNKRNNTKVTVCGTTKTASQWCDDAGIPSTTLSFWRNNYSEEEVSALIHRTLISGYSKNEKQKGIRIKCTTTGDTFKSVREAARSYSLNRMTLTRRIAKGQAYRGYKFEVATE